MTHINGTGRLNQAPRGTGLLNQAPRGTAPLNPAALEQRNPPASPARASDSLTTSGAPRERRVAEALARYENSDPKAVDAYFQTLEAEDDQIAVSTVVGARATRTGVDANQQIVDAYVAVDEQMQAFLGDPPVANWTTFGKYAGRAAGQSIADLEQALELIADVELHELDDLAEVLKKLPQLMPVAVPLLRDAYQKATGEELPEGLTDLDEMLKLGKNLLGGLTGGLLGRKNPVGEVRAELLKSAQTLRDNLVEANVAINNSFQPAFEAFLKAEQGGEDGVAAVRSLVERGTLSDPDGLIVDAMRSYKQAGELTAKATAAAPAERPALLAQRQALIERANLLVGLHEQYHVASRAFNDPEFAHLVGLTTPALAVSDATGRHQLLPHGGNWADFETRMGMEQVPAAKAEAALQGNADLAGELFALTHPKTGEKQYFRPAADPAKREGTIYEFFTRGATGPGAVANMEGAPPAIGSDRIVRQAQHLLESCDLDSPAACREMADTMRDKHPAIAELLDRLGSPSISREDRVRLQARLEQAAL